MDAASVLGLDALPAPDHPRAAALLEVARDAAAPGGLFESLVDHPQLGLRAAALVRTVLGDDGGAELPPPVTVVMMKVAMLALAMDRSASLLYSELHLDGARPEAAYADEFAAVGPAFATFATDVRDTLAHMPGWPAGCAAFGTALATIVDVLAQDRQVGGIGTSVAWRDAADLAGADLVATAAAIVIGDRTLMLHPNECELALRLANGAVARAREVIAFIAEDGPLRPDEMIARRFAVPAGVIRLGASEIERCLRALFAAEVLDLADLLGELGAVAPLRGVLARTVHGMIALSDPDGELVIATVRADHDAIMNELRVAARLDGRITADERALLRGMDEHLHDFDGLIRRIREDHVVDFEEFRQLRTSRQAILDDALRIALADDVVTDDERELVVRVLELLPMLRPIGGRRRPAAGDAVSEPA